MIASPLIRIYQGRVPGFRAFPELHKLFSALP